MNPPPTSPDFAAQRAAVAAAVEARLQALLADDPRPGEIARPPRLVAAMRHALLGGGKRFRPYLVVASAALFDVPMAAALDAAAAVECLHTYSLVHDDLPAMDDDDLRRGRPTVHRAFDEATAILAGDALLTLAFDVLARDGTHPDPAVRAALVLALARAAGLGGMVGGQMLDLEAERSTFDEAAIRRMQAMKTGALIACCCEMGALLGRAPEPHRAALASYGRELGLAFQIADDLLDLEASAEALGKAAAKDAARGKATLVARLGPAEARAALASAVAACADALAPFGGRAGRLVEAARFAAERPS
ncbi:polyprenyl synthetase family protein [Faunimonas sp. B44]|uniref:polyprenyl synthetase family protein n=1 Tax=Faunimonas sp. B44 TaxID=3461493 RepID=UPI004044105C